MASNHWEIIKAGITVTADTPEGLMDMAMGYFKWCDNNPIQIKRSIQVGKQAGESYVEEKTRPYSLEGLCIHCGISKRYLIDLSRIKAEDSLFAHVIERILYVIYTQNLEMGLVGEFNPIMVGKILNMDKPEDNVSDIKITIEEGTPELAKSEAELLESLKAEVEERKKIEE